VSALDGRVAVVTGTSSGLGTQFAKALDGAGARVVLASRRHELALLHLSVQITTGQEIFLCRG
jgi:NADP-dependent 3-hydroxy acid dehydrogenase YdfG